MFLSKVITATVLSAGVATADFMVYTEPPVPTSAVPTFSDASASASWTTMIYINALVKFGDWTSSGGSTYQSSLTSANSAISAFAAASSNANYSIPAAVTEEGTTTFYSKPAWYTALPSGVREFKEKQVSAQFSAVRDVVSRRASTAATATNNGAGSRETPRVGFAGVGTGAMAAIAAGVFL
ncbi:hypothetical protein P280DRAFT_512557 [Massarina eburnea CBS 473.64]|uniref:Uncharacterized protein n=1 Tax=Massarina eburnea CBS 473.64 TaxID=1395130 RepID=A0A6A6SFP7_9PLEO|nr:hypothetical protein P280DRAFT_512557 [Massarina eburnea CBS 473.64]